MHYKLPQYFSGHVAAFIGVATLHGGLMAWQMMPEPPVAIPQQQVIQVSMITPSAPRIESVPEIKAVPAPSLPSSTKGMKKVQPEAKPKPQLKKPIEPQKIEITPQKQPAPDMQTPSRTASAEATAMQAAVTEPIAADYLRNPPPVYPRTALRKRLQGTVMIEVRVSADGLPLLVSLDQSSGHAVLDKAALEAVQKWKFVPAHRGSEVVEASVVVPVEFRIN